MLVSIAGRAKAPLNRDFLGGGDLATPPQRYHKSVGTPQPSLSFVNADGAQDRRSKGTKGREDIPVTPTHQ